MVVRAEFAPKANSYDEQNFVSNPFTLKVLEVNGRKLKEPVLIEYLLEADESERKKLERADTVQEFEAYETLYQPPFATPWLGEGMQGSSFYLKHLLHIRAAKK